MTELFGLGLFSLGLGLFGSVFGLRLIMPRVSYEYHGSADPTRTRQEALDKIEVKARIRELFNLANPNYVRLSDIEHAFKLARPPPKVTHLALYP